MPEYPQLQWTSELIKRYWDFLSDHSEQTHFGKIAGDFLIRKVKGYLQGDPRIFDYGCGTAYLTEALLRRGYRVFGYDSSPHSIELAKERLKKYSRLLGLSSGAIPEGLYDVIFCSEVIEHLYDADMERALNDIRKLLAPRGLLILSTPYEENLSDHTVFCPNCEHLFHTMQHVRSWSEQSLSGYLGQHSFNVKKLIKTDLTASYSWRPWVRLRYGLGRIKPTNLICICQSQGAL